MCCCDELGHPMDVPGFGLYYYNNPYLKRIHKVQLRIFSPLLAAALSFCLYPSLDSFFKAIELLVGFFRVHLSVLWWWFMKTPDDYYLITSCWISSVVTYAVTAYIRACHGVWPVNHWLVHTTTSLRVLWHLAALDIHLELPGLYRNLTVPMWHLLTSI